MHILAFFFFYFANQIGIPLPEQKRASNIRVPNTMPLNLIRSFLAWSFSIKVAATILVWGPRGFTPPLLWSSRGDSEVARGESVSVRGKWMRTLLSVHFKDNLKSENSCSKCVERQRGQSSSLEPEEIHSFTQTTTRYNSRNNFVWMWGSSQAGGRQNTNKKRCLNQVLGGILECSQSRDDSRRGFLRARRIFGLARRTADMTHEIEQKKKVPVESFFHPSFPLIRRYWFWRQN